MLSNIKPSILIFMFLLFTILSCKKEKKSNYNGAIPTTPKENTYSTVFCKINDTLWNDCQKGMPGYFLSNVAISYRKYDQGTPLEMEIRNSCDSIFRRITFILNPFNGKGNYYLYQKGKSYGVYDFFDTKSGKSYFYYTDNDHNGKIEITEFDTLKSVISGNFYFNASDSINEVKITEGVLTKVKY